MSCTPSPFGQNTPSGSSQYGSICKPDTPYPSVSHESIPSQIDNLVNALYGAITKTVQNGRVIWNIPCDPNNTTSINGLPRNTNEGLLCYILRCFNSFVDTQYPVTLNTAQTLSNKTLLAATLSGGSSLTGGSTISGGASLSGGLLADTLTLSGGLTASTFTGDVSQSTTTSTGSTTSRTLANRFSSVVNVLDYGADPTGTADSTTAIQAAINYVQTLHGGTVVIPQGTFNVSSPINITGSNVRINGEGGDCFHDGGTGAYPATKIIWNGGTNINSVFHFYTPKSSSNSKRCGSSISNVLINCQGLISGGINIESMNGGEYANITIIHPTYVGLQVSCWSAGDLAEAVDSQRNIFTNIQVRCLDLASCINANGFILTNQTAGTGGANASFNAFIYCGGQFVNGSGWVLADCDNNTFISCGAYLTGTGKGLDIQGGDSNYFYGFSCGGYPSKLYVRGTASGFFRDSTQNCFMFPDSNNSTNYPFVDTGCKITWYASDGVNKLPRNVTEIVSDFGVNANALYSSAVASLTIDNANQNSIVLTKSGSYTNRWGINVGSGTSGFDLRFNTNNSSAIVNLGNGAPVTSASIYPIIDNTFSCGKSGNRWNAVWAANGTIQTSDGREKTDVTNSILGLDFINSLRPVSYKFKVGGNVVTGKDENENLTFEPVAGVRTHWGLIAQEVQQSIPFGVDFAGWVLTDKENPTSAQGLRYEEFIAPLIKAIQEQQAQIIELQSKVAALTPK